MREWFIILNRHYIQINVCVLCDDKVEIIWCRAIGPPLAGIKALSKARTKQEGEWNRKRESVLNGNGIFIYGHLKQQTKIHNENAVFFIAIFALALDARTNNEFVVSRSFSLFPSIFFLFFFFLFYCWKCLAWPSQSSKWVSAWACRDPNRKIYANMLMI